MVKPVAPVPPPAPRPRLTDKERLDIQFGKHKPARAADGLPKASRLQRPGFGANYGPSASYTPASDNVDSAGYVVPDRSDSYPVGE